MTRKQSQELIAQLNRDAERIAGQFGLVYRCIEAERANVKRRYGVCYSDGTIRIRVRHAVSGKPLKYSSLVNTLCHELAHLKHFNHGLRFRDFYRRLLEWARVQRIYRPTAGAPPELLDSAARPRPDEGIAGRGIPTRPRMPKPESARAGPPESLQTGSGILGEQLSLFG